MPDGRWYSLADGEYCLRLVGKRIREVEAKLKTGLGDIYARTNTGVYLDADGSIVLIPQEAKWRDSELIEVLRQAIIGGGRCIVDGDEKTVSDYRANQIIDHYIDGFPRKKLWEMAAAVLNDTFEGYEEPKKAEPPKAEALNESEGT